MSLRQDKIQQEGAASQREYALARFVYGLLALVYVVCIVIQVFFAGLGVFVNPENLALHDTFVNYFEFVPVVMFIVSFFARARGGLRWLCLILFALTALQHLTIRVFTGILPALHTVDALLLFWVSLHLMKRSLTWLTPGKKAGKQAKSIT